MSAAAEGDHAGQVTETARARPTSHDLTSREKSAVGFQAVLVLGAVPDVVVALVRTARRDRGVQLGSPLVSLLLAAGAPGVARWAWRRQGRLAGAVLLGYAAAVPLAPAVAGAVRATVVGTRHPLWQLAVSATARGVSAYVVAMITVRRLRREARLSGA